MRETNNVCLHFEAADSAALLAGRFKRTLHHLPPVKYSVDEMYFTSSSKGDLSLAYVVFSVNSVCNLIFAKSCHVVSCSREWPDETSISPMLAPIELNQIRTSASFLNNCSLERPSISLMILD